MSRVLIANWGCDTGTVLVTFKSHQSVPPYRIENQCSDVYIYFVQACLAGERPGRWNWLQPRANGNSLAYAWDEPSEEHLLRVKVRLKPIPSNSWQVHEQLTENT